MASQKSLRPLGPEVPFQSMDGRAGAGAGADEERQDKGVVRRGADPDAHVNRNKGPTMKQPSHCHVNT